MTYRCEKCGQPALETDTVCWHCGWHFSKTEIRKSVKKVKPVSGKEQEVSLTAVSVYAGLTLVTLLALLLVMASLDRRPFYRINPDLSLGPGWLPLTDRAQRFTLNLPPQWQYFDGQEADQRAGFDALIADNGRFHAALALLANIASDTELLIVAASTRSVEDSNQSPFLIVARSAHLKQLSIERALDLLRQSGGNPLEATLIESATGENRIDLLREIDMGSDTFRCRDQLVEAQEADYLVTVCAPQTGYARYRNDIEAMLAGFQPLSR